MIPAEAFIGTNRLWWIVAMILLGGCNRANVDAALGRECSNGASCYDQAGTLVQKIYKKGVASKERLQEMAAERAKAVALFQKGCDLGSGPSCHMLGFWLEEGDLTTPDPPRAARLHERGCALKEFRSCDALAKLFRDGRGVPKDPALQAKYRKLACELAEPPMAKDAFCKEELSADAALRRECSDGDNCRSLAQVLVGSFFGVKSGREKAAPEKAAEWAARAVVLYQKGCDLGDGQSCTDLGEDFRIGGLAGIDLPRAARLFEKGCGLKDEVSCYELARLYRDGEGVPKNRVLQEKYRKLACNFAPPAAKDEFCNLQ